MNLFLTLLIYSLPLGVLSRIQIFPNVFIYLNDIFAGVIFVIFLWKQIIGKIRIDDKKIFIPWLGFFAVGFVSLLINFQNLNLNSFFVSLLYGIRYFVYSSLIFVVASLDAVYLKSLNKKMIISGLIFMVFGFIQFFYYPNLRNLNYLGWDEHEFRLFSTFFDPNFAGAFLVLLLLLIISNLKYVGKKTSSIYSNKSFLLIMGVFTIVAIYITHSRSALISLFFGIAAFLFIIKKTKLIIPIVIILFVAQFIFANFKAEGANPLRIVSSEARIASAIQASTIFLKHPIMGVGFDSFRYARIKESQGKDLGSRTSNAGAGTDNSFLFVLATTGILGLVFLIKFWFEVLRKVFFSVRTSKDPKALILSVATFSSIIAIFIDSFFINTLFYPLIVSWVFILIGATLSSVVKSRNEKKSP